MFQIQRLNHAVLYVRDAERVARFYQEVLGFVVTEHMGDRAYFLKTNATTDNNHDLGLFSIGANAPAPTQGERVGLYHLAWQVDTVDELEQARTTLVALDGYTGESSHGATKSVYGHDPDGNEFEIMWMLPREEWGDYENAAPIEHLDLSAELRRWSGVGTAGRLQPGSVDAPASETAVQAPR